MKYHPAVTPNISRIFGPAQRTYRSAEMSLRCGVHATQVSSPVAHSGAGEAASRPCHFEKFGLDLCIK
jgi:hypothetical protein